MHIIYITKTLDMISPYYHYYHYIYIYTHIIIITRTHAHTHIYIYTYIINIAIFLKSTYITLLILHDIITQYTVDGSEILHQLVNGLSPGKTLQCFIAT